jgi:beta-lactamase superfamily II metal-dependent hydrolase
LSAACSRIIVWDVGHGSSVSILAPNGKTAMIDLGANTDTGFSPTRFTKAIWRPKGLDYLILSHPHVDHIRDIVNLEPEGFLPKVLRARNIPREKLIGEDVNEKDREALETYLALKSKYSGSVDSSLDPRSSSWGAGAYFSNYSIDADWETEPNNTSIVTFFKIGGFTFVYPGDIEARGWRELLRNDGFVKDLKTTQFFVASHHGREAGFVQEVMNVAKPRLVIISDSEYKDTSVTSRYSNQATGFNVTDENNDVTGSRNVVSTRSDGRVIIDVYYDGNETTAQVKLKRSSG